MTLNERGIISRRLIDRTANTRHEGICGGAILKRVFRPTFGHWPFASWREWLIETRRGRCLRLLLVQVLFTAVFLASFAHFLVFILLFFGAVPSGRQRRQVHRLVPAVQHFVAISRWRQILSTWRKSSRLPCGASTSDKLGQSFHNKLQIILKTNLINTVIPQSRQFWIFFWKSLDISSKVLHVCLQVSRKFSKVFESSKTISTGVIWKKEEENTSLNLVHVKVGLFQLRGQVL